MILASLAAALLAGSVILPAASAEPDNSWQRYPCAVGSLDVASATFAPGREPDVVSITVPGEVGCGVPDPGPRFGLAVYEPGAGSGWIDRSAGLHEYASPNGPTSFVLSGGVRVGQEEVRLCIVSDYDARLACVGFTAGPFGVKVLTVETSDPEVAVPINVVSSTANPLCGTCWTVNDR